MIFDPALASRCDPSRLHPLRHAQGLEAVRQRDSQLKDRIKSRRAAGVATAARPHTQRHHQDTFAADAGQDGQPPSASRQLEGLPSIGLSDVLVSTPEPAVGRAPGLRTGALPAIAEASVADSSGTSRKDSAGGGVLRSVQPTATPPIWQEVESQWTAQLSQQHHQAQAAAGSGATGAVADPVLAVTGHLRSTHGSSNSLRAAALRNSAEQRTPTASTTPRGVSETQGSHPVILAVSPSAAYPVGAPVRASATAGSPRVSPRPAGHSDDVTMPSAQVLAIPGGGAPLWSRPAQLAQAASGSPVSSQ